MNTGFTYPSSKAKKKVKTGTLFEHAEATDAEVYFSPMLFMFKLQVILKQFIKFNIYIYIYNYLDILFTDIIIKKLTQAMHARTASQLLRESVVETFS